MDYNILIPDYSEDLSKHMYQLQQKGVLCDAWLVCKDGIVFIHKLVLMACCSPYLQQQVSVGSQSNNSQCNISLKDYSLKTVYDLVRALYTGKLTVNQERVVEAASLCSFLGLTTFTQSIQSISANVLKLQCQVEPEVKHSAKEESENVVYYQVEIAQGSVEVPLKVQVIKNDQSMNGVVDSTCDDQVGQVQCEIQTEEVPEQMEITSNASTPKKTVIGKHKIIKKMLETCSPQKQARKGRNGNKGDNQREMKTNSSEADNTEQLFSITKNLSTANTDQSSLEEMTSDIPKCNLCGQVLSEEDVVSTDNQDTVCQNCNGIYTGEHDYAATDVEKINEIKVIKGSKKKIQRKKRPRRGDYTQEEMLTAFNEAKESNMSVRAVARKHNVPFNTLRDRLVGRVRLDCRNGRNCLFNVEQEKKLSDFLIELGNLGYGYTREGACKIASHYAFSLGKRNRENLVKINWWHRFREVWPKVKDLRQQHLTLMKNPSSGHEYVAYFFSSLEDLFMNHNILEKPHLLYNIIGIELSYDEPYFLNEYDNNDGEHQETITLFACGSASGESIPPCYVFPETTMRVEYLLDDCKPGFGILSESKWFDSEIFLSYVQNHFLKHTPRDVHKIVLLDGHSLYLSLNAVEWGKENNTTFLVVPANYSNSLQPLDIGCLSKFEESFTNECKSRSMFPSQRLDRPTLCNSANIAYFKAFSKENLIAAYRMTGIFPINKDV